MSLSLPSFTFRIERNFSVKLKPRHINTKKLKPNLMSFIRCHFGFFIYNVLKMVNKTRIAEKI